MSCYLDLYWATQEDLSLGPLKATEGFQVFFFGGGGEEMQGFNNTTRKFKRTTQRSRQVI